MLDQYRGPWYFEHFGSYHTFLLVMLDQYRAPCGNKPEIDFYGINEKCTFDYSTINRSEVVLREIYVLVGRPKSTHRVEWNSLFVLREEILTKSIKVRR
ncbi:hypothetical protein CEXT_367502 [Caerostris extrusa]|nr:hypothetical protein CEXT_367502 [Caerostris extrusa]